MRKLVLIALLGGASWWYFIGGRALSEEKVTDFYRQVEHASLSRDPEGLCKLLSNDFESTGTVSAAGQSTTSTMNKVQTCDAYVQLYDTFDKLGNAMGGMVQLDSSYEIHEITISDDKKTATVDISTSLDVAGSVMQIKARSTDTLIRQNGKVLMLRSDGTGSVSTGSRRF